MFLNLGAYDNFCWYGSMIRDIWTSDTLSSQTARGRYSITLIVSYASLIYIWFFVLFDSYSSCYFYIPFYVTKKHFCLYLVIFSPVYRRHRLNNLSRLKSTARVIPGVIFRYIGFYYKANKLHFIITTIVL